MANLDIVDFDGAGLGVEEAQKGEKEGGFAAANGKGDRISWVYERKFG